MKSLFALCTCREPPDRAAAQRAQHSTGRTLWTAEEDAELAQLVHEHGVIDTWDSMAEIFSVSRSGNALSKRWAKIREQWQDADSVAAAAVASSRRKKRRDDEQAGAPSKKHRGDGYAEEEQDDAEWLATVDVGDDVEVRDRQSWYACKVVVSEEQRVKIHFVGCGRRYDRWVQRSADFLRRRAPPQESSSSEEEEEESEGSDHEGWLADRTAWTAAEDAELSQLVRQYGVGSWSVMREFFSSGRSTNALKNRWMRLTRQGGARGHEEEVQGGWTLREDLELLEAVRKTGARDWAGKQAMLSHSRSASAIRTRWARLEEDAETAGDQRVRVWNKTEHRMLAGAVRALHFPLSHSFSHTILKSPCAEQSAPRRENLQRYLREHPDMEVYAGQDRESEYDEEEFEVPHTPGWLASIEAGTRLEARDRTGWYEAKVIEVEKARVKIHYIGFAPKYDVWAERGLNWLRPRVVPKQSAHSRSSKSGHSASPADVELSAGRAALLEQVGKLKQTHFEPTGGYSKTCLDCGRIFTHAPAYASHVGSATCKEDAARAKQQRQQHQQNGKQATRSQFVPEPTAPPRGSPTVRGDVPDPDPRSWSAEEDRALLELVRSRRAASDWTTRAAQFPYNRSSSAMRNRWFKLQEDAADKMTSARRREQQKEQQRQAEAATKEQRPAENKSFDQFPDPPEVSKVKPTHKAPPGWSKEEEAELRQLVAKHGVGNWGAIEAELSTGRSSGAVRKRWNYVIAADSSGGSGGSGGEVGAATAPARPSSLPSQAKQPVVSAATKWTADEDLELVRLVKEHGVTRAGTGNPKSLWDTMAEAFSRKFTETTRSGGGLRGRWQRLEDEAAAVGTTALDMRVSLWHKADSVVIKGVNAPRREDLPSYLSDHAVRALHFPSPTHFLIQI